MFEIKISSLTSSHVRVSPNKIPKCLTLLEHQSSSPVSGVISLVFCYLGNCLSCSFLIFGYMFVFLHELLPRLIIFVFHTFISCAPHHDREWLITGFVTRLTRRMLLVEEEELNLPDHPSSTPIFIGVHVTRSLSLCVMFCRSLSVLLYFFIWPLCCLFFFDLRILITPLISSSSSYSFSSDI